MRKKRAAKNQQRRTKKTTPVNCDGCGRGAAPVGGKCNFCGKSIEVDTNCGEIDQAAFEGVIRDNLSPAGAAALVMALQPAGSIQATTPEGERAIEQVIWFRNTLLEMIGVESFNRMLDELGF